MSGKSKKQKQKQKKKAPQSKTKVVYVEKKSPLVRGPQTKGQLSGTTKGSIRAKPQQSMTTLSKCGLTYFTAIHAPLSVQGRVCYPGPMPQKSMKVVVTTRGSFNATTNGVGGVGFWPYRMFAQANPGNQAWRIESDPPEYWPAIITSKVTSSASDYNFLNASHQPVSADMGFFAGTSSLFTQSQMDGEPDLVRRQVRLVAAGIRVYYKGAEVDRQGDYIIWRNPNASDAVEYTVDAVSNMLSFNQASTHRVSDQQSAYCSFVPIKESDSDYQADVRPYNGAFIRPDDIRSRLACAILLDGVKAGAPYGFEAKAFFEMTGLGMVTDSSDSDPAAVGVATGAVSNLPLPMTQLEQLRLATANAIVAAKMNGVNLDMGNLARLLPSARDLK